MRRTIFARYFLVCASIVILATLILGILFISIASSFFKEDKYNTLMNNARMAIESVTPRSSLVRYNSVTGEVSIDREMSGSLMLIGRSTGAIIFIVDKQGNTLVCSEERPQCKHTTYKLPEKVMEKVNQNSGLKETGDLEQYYRGGSFCTVAMPFYLCPNEADPGEESNWLLVGYIFVSSDAETLDLFLYEVVKLFLLSSTFVLLLGFIVIYFITRNLTKPLRDMVSAAGRFGKGEFTSRINALDNSSIEIEKLTKAFNDMASSLAVTESARRSFVSNVSHELKTPMTTISGFIDGILDGTISSESSERYLRVVSEETKRLSRVVKSMLNISKIEAGEMKISPDVYDLNELVIKGLFAFEDAIEHKRIEIRGLGDNKIYGLFDSDMVYQVLYNLLDNAVKFTPEGGYIEVRYKLDRGMIYTFVRNSGEGISGDDLPHLFERFYKVDKSRSLDANGFGLGLYIVKTIVNMNGGEIEVDSVFGEYCEFSFSLPQAKKPYIPKVKRVDRRQRGLGL